MAAMPAVGAAQRLPSRALVHEEPRQYVVELDVSDFREGELTVAACGRHLSVRGDQRRTAADDGEPFRFHECLEESFRLPDDAEDDSIKVFHKHGRLEIHVPRVPLEPRHLPIEHARFLIDPDAEAC